MLLNIYVSCYQRHLHILDNYKHSFIIVSEMSQLRNQTSRLHVVEQLLLLKSQAVKN